MALYSIVRHNPPSGCCWAARRACLACAASHSVNMVPTSVKVATVHYQCALECRQTSKHYRLSSQETKGGEQVVGLKGRLKEFSFVRQSCLEPRSVGYCRIEMGD